MLDKFKNFYNDPIDKPQLIGKTRKLWKIAYIIVGGIFAILLFIILFKVPSFEQLENPDYDLASTLYSDNGTQFGKYYVENREFVNYEDLNQFVVQALLSTEDERYYEHSGIDFTALMRVGVKTLILGQKNSGGGSTITQQLSKLLYKRESLGSWKPIRVVKMIGIKIKEWITAILLERQYTKEEIVSLYLSKFEFINNAHGIQSASKVYFNKDQKELTVYEAATLAGMLKNPSYYNPMRFKERSRERRNIVLDNMEKAGYIDNATCTAAKAQRLDMTTFTKDDQSNDPAPYFRSELTKWLKKTLAEKQYFDEQGVPYDIYRDGLKIYTTINLDYQRIAEKAMYEQMKINQRSYRNIWDRQNPFETEEGDHPLLYRNRLESVDRRIRNSDFYIDTYNEIFEKYEEKLKDEFQLKSVGETTIRYLCAKDSFYNPNNLLDRKVVDQILKSPIYAEMTGRWVFFKNKVDQYFDVEKIEAKVFAYNDEGFEIKTMTRRDSIIHQMSIVQSGLLSIDPRNGHIKVWVGGVDHRTFKYDHINLKRQIGSTIKPFVYATAISVQGISPCQNYIDRRYTVSPGEGSFDIDNVWEPNNADGSFTGRSYNLFRALQESKNSITVKLVKDMGTIQPIRDLLRNVGLPVDTKMPNGKVLVPNDPAIVLGAIDLSVVQLVSAYTTFANDGIHTDPVYVTRIEDKNGKVIYSANPEQKRALNSTYNAVMLELIKNNIRGNIPISGEIGGKTGTTNDYCDAWFVGVTPTLVTGVWVGGEEKWVRYRSLRNGQGSVLAMPICRKFLVDMEKEAANTGYEYGLSFQYDKNSEFYDLTDCSRYHQIYNSDELSGDDGLEMIEDFEMSPFEEESSDNNSIQNDPAEKIEEEESPIEKSLTPKKDEN